MFSDRSESQSQELKGDNNGSIIQVKGDGNTIIIKPEDIDNFEQQSVLSHTIEYILKENNFSFDFSEEINTPTDLKNKIIVNGINSTLKEYLISGRSKRYLIDELFEENQDYDIENLRKDILKIYNRYKPQIEDMNKIIQKLYNDLFNKFNKKSADLSISLFIIISYFFEICDVGDNPNDIA